MPPETVITDKWIKASIAGTTWAASEIVLGSFLHNLKIPFSGNILTAIGIIILISISYKWNEKGLFWRAGAICAIMKTMSPSAVIFGPMIAIFTEAVLMEGSVRLLGRSIPGYILGGMLAMSWNLFQKIVNFILFYGFNIVAIYSDLLKFTQKQLSIRFDIVWLPILFLLIIYCITGIIAALIGIRAGRRLVHQSPGPAPFMPKGMEIKQRAEQPVFNYSIVWLILDFGLIITALFMFNFFPWYVWTATTVLIVSLWIPRYKRALRQLSRPRFWFWFALITMVTAFVLNKMQSRSLEEGLLIGIQMNFRAIVIILGFSVLGTELYNPVIREFFLKTYFKQLPLALELSFKSLPQMVANVPEFRIFVRNPGLVVYQILSGIDQRLAEIKSGMQQGYVIVTGAVGGGKTTHILQLVQKMKEEKLSVAGIVSLRVMENNQTVGYDVLDLNTGVQTPFLRSSGEGAGTIGRFTILPAGLSAGNRALQEALHGDCKVVVIDEVGQMELDGKGWAPVFGDLVKNGEKRLILSVRDRYLDQVINRWNLKDYEVEPGVTIITSTAEAGTLETMPVAPEMNLMTAEELLQSDIHFHGDDVVCMTSENALEALACRLDPLRRKALETLKDKFLFREILREIFPEFGFKLVKADEIASLSIDRISVIKPRRGIFGTAVRMISPGDDFGLLNRQIREEMERNAKVYTQSVLSAEEFIVEDFLEGEEYAVDLFYDSDGKPCIVNITHHPVPHDVAYIHMMYNMSQVIFDRLRPGVQQFFTTLNEILKVTRFPMHAEIRISGGEIIPVEINPMRFGGMGLGNLVWYALGINPFLYFCHDSEPDWKEAWKGKEEKIFTYFIAYNGKNIRPGSSRPRYDKLKSYFTRVIREQPFDHKKQLAFGVYFLEETEKNIRELLQIDFDEFFVSE